jgi:hypothetical protein
MFETFKVKNMLKSVMDEGRRFLCYIVNVMTKIMLFIVGSYSFLRSLYLF